MAPNRFQLKGTNLDDLKFQVFAEHGPGARILSAERVTQGGIAGFLATRFYELTIEVDDPEPPGPFPRVDVADRVGIAALLAEADGSDSTNVRVPQTLSTSSARFDDVLADLAVRAGLDAPVSLQPRIVGGLPLTAEEEAHLSTPTTAAAMGALPFPLESSPVEVLPSIATGDLMLVVGLGQDALPVARAIAKSRHHAEVRAGGGISIRNSVHITDHRSALDARADAVRRDRSVIVAFGIDPTENVPASLRVIRADQVWAVVDASRKVEDTDRWVRALAQTVGVSALAIIGSSRTSSPHTVTRLGIPIGWMEE